MNRTILTVAGVFSASSLLLVDSAVKGTALLVLAAVAAMILRRDSAATRHLVWLLAIVAMLAVPVLSAMLPQWRVLPEWASIPPRPAVVATSPPSIARPAVGAVELPQNAEPVEVERPSATAYQPAAALPDSRPALVTPEAIPASAVWSWNWLNALPLVWAIGFSVLILRLMAARWMLWNTERQGTVIWSSRQPAQGNSRSHRNGPGSRVFAARDTSPCHPVDSPGQDDSRGLGHSSMSSVASRSGAALERRATAIRSAARARPHQASRHDGSTADADRVCSALVQSAGVVRRLASWRGT